MEPLSVVVTTFNNARTLPACLNSVQWADEVVVLDSFSTDRTVEIVREHGATLHQRLGIIRGWHRRGNLWALESSRLRQLPHSLHHLQ